MPSHPIPLYPYPPFSPSQLQGEPHSDESDFPPCRIHKDDINEHEDVSANEHVHVNPVSDASSDFPPIRIHASTPDSSNRAHSPTRPHAHGGSPHPHLRLELQSPQQLQHSQPLKKRLGRKNILNFTTHIAAQPSKPAKRKCLESTQVTEERLSKCRRLTFDQTDMDWLKIELHDIKFEIGEVRSSMIEIAECLHTVEDDHLEHILFPV